MGNKPTSQQLRPEALSDLRKQTEFTEDELQQWYSEFIKGETKTRGPGGGGGYFIIS